MKARSVLLAATIGMPAGSLSVVSGCTDEWMNPRAHFDVDVKDDAGDVTNWDLKFASPDVLLMQSWRRDSLQAADQVTIEGFLAKDGINTANARRVTLPDGRKVLRERRPKASRPRNRTIII
jgi:hypothetical protein